MLFERRNFHGRGQAARRLRVFATTVTRGEGAAWFGLAGEFYFFSEVLTQNTSNGPRVSRPLPCLDCMPRRYAPARASAVRSSRSLFCKPQLPLRSTRHRLLHLLARTISH